MKYLIHNVQDSDWNIIGNKFTIYVTDPSIPHVDKVLEFGDPLPADFIGKQVIESEYDSIELMVRPTHRHFAIMRCFEWILSDHEHRIVDDPNIECVITFYMRPIK